MSANARVHWTKGKLVGAKPPLRPRHVGPQQVLNGPCDHPAKEVRQAVRFELADQTRMAIDEYLRLTRRKPGQSLFASRGDRAGLTTRQHARLMHKWGAGIDLDRAKLRTRPLRRTKAVLIYRRKGNLRAVQLLLGHSKIRSIVRYLGIEADAAIKIAEKIEICVPDALPPIPDVPAARLHRRLRCAGAAAPATGRLAACYVSRSLFRCGPSLNGEAWKRFALSLAPHGYTPMSLHALARR